MKVISLILLLMSPLWAGAQSQELTLDGLAPNKELYQQQLQLAADFVAQGKYLEAMERYTSAKDWCPARQVPEVDSLLALMAEKIEAEQNALKNALQKAKEMQAKMETAVFDKAVKTKFPEWKGYNNEYDIDRRKLLTQLDSLDLSQNALPAIPKELAECPNLVYLNLLGNNEIDWTSITRLKDLPKLESIDVSVNDLSDIDSTYWHKITGIEILKNGLVSFPENILAQTQLNTLDLIMNQLTSLPKEIGNLTELKTLDLRGNQLEYV